MSNHTTYTKPLYAALILTGLVAVGAGAQPPTKAGPAKQPFVKPFPVTVAPKGVAPPASSPKSGRGVDYTGDLMDYKEQTKILTITGNAWFKSEETVLTTDAALYNKVTQIASSPGPLKVEDPKNTITGKTGTAYYKTRDAKIRGNVVIVAKPDEQNKTAPEGTSRRQFDSPATITCESVDYNWGTRVAFLTGNLKVVQKDRTLTADKATYEGKLDRVTLEGNVIAIDSKGQKFKSPKVVLGIKEGAESFTAEKVSGTMHDDIIEDEVAGKTPGEKPTDKPGTPPVNPTPNPTAPPPTNPSPGTPPPAPEPGKNP